MFAETRDQAAWGLQMCTRMAKMGEILQAMIHDGITRNMQCSMLSPHHCRCQGDED